MISETAKELGIQLYITTFISEAVIQVLILGVVLLRTLFSFTFMFLMEYNFKKLHKTSLLLRKTKIKWKY